MLFSTRYVRRAGAAAVAEFKTRGVRLAWRVAFLAAALALFWICLAMAAWGAYLALSLYFTAPIAALLTAAGALILAGVFALIAVYASFGKSTSPQPQQALDPGRLKAAVTHDVEQAAGELYNLAERHRGTLTIAALIAGVVIGLRRKDPE